MKQYNSVQDLLKGLGYEEKQVERVFSRGDVKIPFGEIVGHTTVSFLQKARLRGWVTNEEVRQKTDKAPPILDPSKVRTPLQKKSALRKHNNSISFMLYKNFFSDKSSEGEFFRVPSQEYYIVELLLKGIHLMQNKDINSLDSLYVNGKKVEVLDVCDDFATGMIRVRFRIPVSDSALEEWRMR